MMEHYIGCIFNFNLPPEREEINVDIPFFQQTPVKDEVLIQLDERDIKDRYAQQCVDIQNITDNVKEIIKKMD